MADSREIGMRVGAAANQAAGIAAALIRTGALPTDDPKVIATYVSETAKELLVVMNDLQAAELVNAGFAGTTSVQQTFVAAAQASAPVVQHAHPAAAGINEHTPSGSNKPLTLDHPSVPAWAVAQAKAKGVTQLWDNRGKPNYIAAISSGAAKTPPPFRSATEGIDQSFWPPSTR